MSIGPEPENEAAAPVRTTSESDSDDSGGFKSSSNLAELAERCKYVPMRLTDEVRTRPIFGPRRPCSLRGRLQLQVCHGSLSRQGRPARCRLPRTHPRRSVCYGELFRTYTYPTLYREGTRSTRISQEAVF